MRWSIKIATISGIPVRLHLTFLILLLWVGVSHYLPTRDLGAAGAGVLLVTLVFASVVLHEFGHAMAARRYGIGTRDITLLPIGGVARLERMPEDPRGELVVAIAGPAVNALIAATLFATVHAVGRLALPSHPHLPGPGILTQLAWINISLAVFNMIPAFPMDGGRVLRAALAIRFGSARATNIAARTGQALALVFGAIGLFTSPVLVFVALFVWMGAHAENSASMLADAMDGLPVDAAAALDIRVLRSDDRVSLALEHVLAGFQSAFPVVDDGRLLGVVTRDDLLRGLSDGRVDEPVLSVMTQDCAVARSGETLVVAHERMQAGACSAMPIVSEDGRVVGLVTAETIAELLMVRAAAAGQSGA